MARDSQEVRMDAHQMTDEEKQSGEERQETPDKHRPKSNAFQRLLAEALGAFALTVVAAGGIMVSTISHGEVSLVAHYVAGGLVVGAMIYTLGRYVGGSF